MLARLVVLHDPARAERILVDAVDLPGEREPVAEVEPALQLGRRPLAAEEHLEPPRHERELRLALRRAPLLRDRATASSRARAPASRSCPCARPARLVEALAHQAHRSFDDALVEPLDAELLRQAREELVERVVRDGAAQLRVDLRVDRARAEEPLDEPRRRAVGEALELGHVERRLRLELLEHERMRQPRRALERAERALEAPLPRVRARERVGAGRSRDASSASARSRSRSVGASSSDHVSADSGRRRVQRRTSSGSNAACTSSQNGLGSRGLPSSVAASRTR